MTKEEAIDKIVEYYNEMMSDDILAGDPSGYMWFTNKVTEILKSNGWIK